MTSKSGADNISTAFYNRISFECHKNWSMDVATVK